MKNNKELQSIVHAHMLMNPPAEFRSNSVDIILKNSKDVVLTREENNGETLYRLAIANPLNLGLTSREQHNTNNFLSGVVLAFNLILNLSAMTLSGRNMAKYEWIEPAERTADNGSFYVYETSHVTLETAVPEEVDENELIATLNLVHKADLHGTHSKKPFLQRQKLTNIGKALRDYEDAMSNFDIRYIFRALYSALQLATNWDQDPERKGIALDAEIARLLNVPQAQAKDWRDLYNRLKHADEKQSHLNRYEKGTENLPLQIDPIRGASKKVITLRLKAL
jgi:hypothetical protein